MRKKSYDVTPEMVSKLEDGLSFSNFTELSRYLGVLDKHGNALGGNSKKQFLAELNRYVEYQMDSGNKSYTIVKVRPEDEVLPPRPTGGNNKFSLMIQNMIAYHLLKQPNNGDSSIEYFWNPYDLFQACGMIGKQFYRWSEYYCSEELREDAITFRYNAKAVIGRYTGTALKAMARNKEIILKEEPIIFLKRGNTKLAHNIDNDTDQDVAQLVEDVKYVTHHVPTKEEYAIYLKMQTRVIQEFEFSSGRTCHSEQDIILCGKSKEYYERLTEEFQKIFPYDEARSMYHIITEPTTLVRALRRIKDVSCVQEFNNLNREMCENLPTLSSVRRGRAEQIENPDYDSDHPDDQPKFLYEYHPLPDEVMQLFIDNMIRIGRTIESESGIPSSGLRTTVYELQTEFDINVFKK